MRKIYKNRTKGNCFDAYYKLGKSGEGTIGRWTVKNGVGLQGLPRDIRGALAKKFYWDIDFKNGKEEILKNICIKNEWRCDALKEYCENRDEIFSNIIREYDVTREDIKQEFISILFGGMPEELSNCSIYYRKILSRN